MKNQNLADQAKEVVNGIIEFQEGPKNLSQLIRYKVSGENPPRPPPEPPYPDEGDPEGPGSGGNDGIRGLQWVELPNGDLQFTITDPEVQEEMKEKLEAKEPLDIADVLEPATANGLMWLDPHMVGAMTDSPILTDGSVDDNGDFIPEGAKVWWFPDYQVKSPLEELANTGRLVFKIAPVKRKLF